MERHIRETKGEIFAPLIQYLKYFLNKKIEGMRKER